MSTKKVFLLMSYEDTGSGTLTWPKDFSLIGVYGSEKDADTECKRLNDENGVDPDSEDFNYADGETVHEVHSLPFFPTVVKTKKR